MPSPTSYPKSKINILLLENINKSAVNEFKQAGYSQIQVVPKALSENELAAIIGNIHILGIRSKTQITPLVLSKAKKLLSIGCFCIGTNQVDLTQSTRLGISVFNSPYSNTRSVAELVLGNLIMLIRKIPEKNAAAHQGLWLKDHKNCFELRGKTLGIIGYGHIGSQISVLAEAIGMRIIYYDILPKLPLGNAQPMKSLNELLKTADAVSLHVPGGEGTLNLMNATRLKQMKKGSIFINYSRGDVADLNALAHLLDTKHLAGAAVDVFPLEPKSTNDTFTSPLQNMSNVILTPHIGGSTEEAQENIGSDVAAKLVHFIDTGNSFGSCSIPELNLPIQQSTHRLLHIHHNLPGVLGTINSLLSSLQINIAGQYLKTNEAIGYVVLDIEKKGSENLLSALKQIPNTIKTRILY